jgi:hypothetical protein
MEDDDVGNALEQVPVVDAHQLIHSRRAPGVGGRQPGIGQHTVEITQDRRGLVQNETVMLEHRHAAERMPRQMFRRFVGAGRHRRDTVGRALLFERREHCSRERTAWDCVNNEFRHD